MRFIYDPQKPGDWPIEWAFTIVPGFVSLATPWAIFEFQY